MKPGDRIGDYVALDWIDEGASAEIYRMRHVQTDAEYALKLLRVRGDEIRERMMREAKVLTSLQHDNVVRVFELLEWREFPAIVMEYIDGVTMEDWVEDDDPSMADRESVFRQVLAGMSHVHDAGLVHRDLQPANILITDEDTGPRARIIDFGLVKGEQRGLTRAGATLGTPGFMSPEQITSAGGVDQRSDIFSLGCMLYYLCCGVAPFDGRSEVDVFNATLGCKYKSPMFAAPMAPMWVSRVVDGALKKSPGDRFASIEQMVAAMG